MEMLCKNKWIHKYRRESCLFLIWKLFALSSNGRELARAGKKWIELKLGLFANFQDGEIQVNIEESIRGKHVPSWLNQPVHL